MRGWGTGPRTPTAHPSVGRGRIGVNVGLGAGPSLTRSSGDEMDPNQRKGFPTGHNLNIV